MKVDLVTILMTYNLKAKHINKQDSGNADYIVW